MFIHFLYIFIFQGQVFSVNFLQTHTEKKMQVYPCHRATSALPWQM